MNNHAASNSARPAGDASPKKNRWGKQPPPPASLAPFPSASATPSSAPPSRRFLLVALALVVGVFAIFGQALRYEFIIYDTEEFVIKNGAIHNGLTLSGLRWALTTTHGGYWMPLTWASHMLDCQLYGLRPWGHTLSSVLLHAANAVLLLLALSRLTGAFWRAALMAAIFAVHPLRVESVVWVAERKDVLSALFWILTLLAYNHYARGAFAWRRYGLVLLTMLLGLLAKPSVVTLPCLLLLLDGWPLRRWRPLGEAMLTDAPAARPAALPLLLLEKVPFFALAAVFSALTYRAQTEINVIAPLPLTVRLANVPIHYCLYLGKTFWPAGLSIYYPVGEQFPALLKLIPAVLLLGGVTLAAVLGWRRRPYLVLGWFWFLGILVPMIGFVQVFTASIADRYSYLSQIGLAIAFAWGAAELVPRLTPSRNTRFALAAGLLLALMVRAGDQTTLWKDNVTLWRHAVELDKTAHFAWCNLGVAYSRRNDAQNSLKAQLEAIRLYPDWGFYHRNLALSYGAVNNHEMAVREFQAALALDPTDQKSHVDLAWALIHFGRYDEAADHLKEASRLKPGDPLPYAYLGSMYASRNDVARAIESYRKALACDPKNYQGNYYLGVLALSMKDYHGAQTYFEATARLYPMDPNARFQLGALWSARGDRAQAAANYQAALELAQAAGNPALAEQIRGRMK